MGHIGPCSRFRSTDEFYDARQRRQLNARRLVGVTELIERIQAMRDEAMDPTVEKEDVPDAWDKFDPEAAE